MAMTYFHGWRKPVRLYDGTLVRVPVDELCEMRQVGYNTDRVYRYPIHKNVCDFLGCEYSVFDQSDDEYYNVKKVKNRLSEVDTIVHRPLTREELFSLVEKNFEDGIGAISALLMFESFDTDFIYTPYHVDLPAYKKFTCCLLRACGFAARDAIGRSGSFEASYRYDRAAGATEAVTAAKEVCAIYDWAESEFGEPFKIC